MNVGSQTQAVLLLTVHFGKEDKQGAKPLTTSEWARFALWLKHHDLQPASLINGDVASILSTLIDRSITTQRIQRLLERSGALGLSLERWERAGLWVLTRSDADYPERLKRRLRQDSPPVLFGCGKRALLNSGGIAVVGSRDASATDTAFAESIGHDAALQGLSIVSGGARGVDQSAMLGALQREGTAVGVLADSLLRSATSSVYRKYLMSNDLVLVSPFSPEAGFNVGNAMARNRYIYCLSDSAIVVSCTRDKGGTWNGAIEALKARWVPVWVKRTDGSSGNQELMHRGALWLSDPPLNLNSLSADDLRKTSPADDDLPLLARDSVTGPELTMAVERNGSLKESEHEHRSEREELPPAHHAEQPASPLYHLFVNHVSDITTSKPLTAEELADQLELTKQQVNAWLKRAVTEKAVKKIGRPTRYQSVRGQSSLFGESDHARR